MKYVKWNHIESQLLTNDTDMYNSCSQVLVFEEEWVDIDYSWSHSLFAKFCAQSCCVLIDLPPCQTEVEKPIY